MCVCFIYIYVYIFTYINTDVYLLYPKWKITYMKHSFYCRYSVNALDE